MLMLLSFRSYVVVTMLLFLSMFWLVLFRCSCCFRCFFYLAVVVIVVIVDLAIDDVAVASCRYRIVQSQLKITHN